MRHSQYDQQMQERKRAAGYGIMARNYLEGKEIRLVGQGASSKAMFLMIGRQLDTETDEKTERREQEG